MRRFLAIFLFALTGVLVASASSLDVDGGIIQSFHMDADVEIPAQICDQEEADETSPPSSDDGPEDPTEVSLHQDEEATACSSG